MNIGYRMQLAKWTFSLYLTGKQYTFNIEQWQKMT